jgi:hypothetical protein
MGLVGALVLAASALAAPAAAPGTPNTAVPGTVNYVEGQVSVNGAPVNSTQNGHEELQPNELLTTQSGKAEVLLSPGIFLRVGNNSEIRMMSAELVNPRVELVRGEALAEVDRKDGKAVILERGAEASILKAGLYRFDGDRGTVAVLDGKIRVSENDKSKEFGKGKEVVLNGSFLKPEDFDVKAQKQDDLYQWSNIRSDYLAQANQWTAQNIYTGFAPYWGAGWYWNPYFTAWSWLPGDGFFYGPFGYPFYSPRVVVYAPYRSYWGGGRFGRPVVTPRAYGFAGSSHFNGNGFRSGGVQGGGFHGGFRGGGVHR